MYSWITKTVHSILYLPSRMLYENKKVQNVRMGVFIKHIAILSCLATEYFFAEI